MQGDATEIQAAKTETTVSVSGTPIPQDVLTKDVFKVILRWWWKTIRHKNPELWETIGYKNRFKVDAEWTKLKFVSRRFRALIAAIESDLDSVDSFDKWVMYNNVDYADQALNLEPEKSFDQCFILETSDDIVAVRQLGNQPTHFWAPLLTCNSRFELGLYSLPPIDTNESRSELLTATLKASYINHKAKLTAALSMGDIIISGDAAGYVGVWSENNTPDYRHRFFQAHRSKVTAIDYVSSTKFMTAGDNQVKQWDLKKTDPVQTFEFDAPVRDLRAKSMDEFLVLTLSNTHIATVILVSKNQKKILLSHKFVSNRNFMMADDVRMLGATRLVGMQNDGRNKYFELLDLTDPDARNEIDVKIEKPIGLKSVFLSRGNYCAFFIAQNNNRKMVSFHVESSKNGFLLPNNNW